MTPPVRALPILLLTVIVSPTRADERPVSFALAWRHHVPVAADPETGGLSGAAARELVTRTAYVASALLREHLDVRASVCLSSSLLFQIEHVYLRRLLPHLDRARNRVDAEAVLAGGRGRIDPWIDQALAPALEPVVENRDGDVPERVRRFFPQLDSLLAKRPSEHSLEDITSIACWRLLSGFAPVFLESRTQLASGAPIDLRDLIRRGPGGVYLATRAFSRDDANRLVAEVAKVLESFVLVHRAQRRAPDSPGGNIDLVTTPFLDPPLERIKSVRPFNAAGSALFERVVGWPPSAVVTEPRWSSFGLDDADRDPAESIARLLGTSLDGDGSGPGETRVLVALDTGRIARGSTRDLHGEGFIRALYRELDRRRSAGAIRMVAEETFQADPIPKTIVAPSAAWERVRALEIDGEAIAKFALEPESVPIWTRARLLLRSAHWLERDAQGEAFESLLRAARD